MNTLKQYGLVFVAMLFLSSNSSASQIDDSLTTDYDDASYKAYLLSQTKNKNLPVKVQKRRVYSLIHPLKDHGENPNYKTELANQKKSSGAQK